MSRNHSPYTISLAAVLSASCGSNLQPAAPTSSALVRLNPATEVGSIIDSAKGTLLCGPRLGIKAASSVVESADLRSASHFGAEVEAAFTGYLTAKAEGQYLESLSIHLEGGKIEGATAEAAARRWGQLSLDCQSQIRQAEEKGSERFDTILSVYRGKFSVHFKFRAGATANAKAKITEEFELAVKAKAESTQDDSISFKDATLALQVQGLTVYGPKEPEAKEHATANVIRWVRIL